jgi:phage terminase small subunit
MLTNLKYEQFCKLIIAGHSQTEAAKRSGFPPGSAHNAGSRLMKREDVRRRIAELRAVGNEQPEAPAASAMTLQGIRTNDARVAGYEARRNQLLTIIQERANDPEMLNVAGGKTGLLVRTVKRDGGL